MGVDQRLRTEVGIGVGQEVGFGIGEDVGFGVGPEVGFGIGPEVGFGVGQGVNPNTDPNLLYKTPSPLHPSRFQGWNFLGSNRMKKCML